MLTDTNFVVYCQSFLPFMSATLLRHHAIYVLLLSVILCCLSHFQAICQSFCFM
jgi:hypothetical protein